MTSHLASEKAKQRKIEGRCYFSYIAGRGGCQRNGGYNTLIKKLIKVSTGKFCKVSSQGKLQENSEPEQLLITNKI